MGCSGELVMITVAGDLGRFSSCHCADGITHGCDICNNSCHRQVKMLFKSIDTDLSIAGMFS